jgi:hypothetical protein
MLSAGPGEHNKMPSAGLGKRNNNAERQAG